MGHYSVATALKQELEKNNEDVHIDCIDILEYAFPSLSNLIYGAFNFMVSKVSFVYNFFNGVAEQYNDVPFKGIVSKKVSKIIDDFNPDLIIATLPVCSQYISTYKEITKDNIPLYTYITDISAHEEWISKLTDRYFVGSLVTKEQLINKGIDEENIIVSGIPVRENFKDVREIKTLKQKKNVLIMGGGLGLIPSYDKFIEKLSHDENVDITVITGTNEALKKDIEKNFSNINVVGYTNEVNLYMEKADLIITKSGGITLFEAIHTHTPLYIIKPFLTQEVGNAKYIEDAGIGKVVWSDKTDVYKDMISLLNNDKLLYKMKLNTKELLNGLDNISAMEIYENTRGLECC